MSFFYANRSSVNNALRQKRIANQQREREQKRLEGLTTTLTDNDVMAWGKHKGQKLGNVPFNYWRWFLDQDWCEEKPDLFAYAQRKLGGVQ